MSTSSGWSGWLFEHLGVMPVAREGGTAAEASLVRGGDVLASGALLGVYPEGTRSPDGWLYRGKTGPVRDAMRTRAPIVPIGLIGTREVMPPRSRLPRPGSVTVRFGRPLRFPRRLSDDHRSVRDATDEVMRGIMTLSGQRYVDAYAAHGRSPGRVASNDGDRVGDEPAAGSRSITARVTATVGGDDRGQRVDVRSCADPRAWVQVGTGRSRSIGRSV